MFTGIIEEIGIIRSLSVLGNQQLELDIGCSNIQTDLKDGDSVAIDGVCLTVIRFTETDIWFELSPETFKLSTFSFERKGKKVNLERALPFGGRLGGHLVQGHVDYCSTVLGIKKMGSFYEIDFSLDQEMGKYVAQKGSIAVNGISLTIASLAKNRFKVAVIPHTYHHTTLSEVKISDTVHIETDVISRYIERLLPFPEKEVSSPVTFELLRQHGF